MKERVLAKVIRESVKKLTAAGIESPQTDARILIANALVCDRAELIANSTKVVSEDEEKLIFNFISRRCKREPVGRILGKREFRGLVFFLNEATLEPRPDSETLIDAVISKCDREKQWRILDLGTGTGCLLLSLLSEMPNATGIGVDCDERAVKKAQENANSLGLQNRAFFRKGNWLEGIAETFDIIVCNPPYVARGDIQNLAPEVREYDPIKALDGGEDGMDVYRHLVPQIPAFIKPQGIAVFECGKGQAKTVADMLEKAGLSNVTIFADLAGVERCVIAQK